jgi:hypothetical protein
MCLSSASFFDEAFSQSKAKLEVLGLFFSNAILS